LKVTEKKVLRKIFGPKKGEVTREWRRLLNEELYDLCSSPYTIWVIKSRRIKWGGGACSRRGPSGFSWGDLSERDL
jgi:hypothetical protein